MSSHRLLTVTLAVLAALGLVTAVALAMTASSPSRPAAATTAGTATESGVLVTGLGTVVGRPDVLRFTVGVEVTADTVDAALARANDGAERVLTTLRDRGIADEDLQTAAVQVYPAYDDRGRDVTGYVVSQSVAVKVRDLDEAGATITAAVEAGGDAARLSGVAFALEDNEELLAAARRQAFDAARAKAEQYADITGADLGGVISVRESLQQGPQPFPAYDTAGGARAEAAASVPIEPGTAEVTVAVDVRWALG